MPTPAAEVREVAERGLRTANRILAEHERYQRAFGGSVERAMAAERNRGHAVAHQRQHDVESKRADEARAVEEAERRRQLVEVQAAQKEAKCRRGWSTCPVRQPHHLCPFDRVKRARAADDRGCPSVGWGSVTCGDVRKVGLTCYFADHG
jgi:hypothetical protein